ncbi:1,5-anhydro-D-fructose reductase [Poriferisphaera corsica]|uniref:1,5-anhydro-D-fructose reductase n=1 Tax=Poriferisphaera corsica TaxID=2528020 RepID=A0A517YX91_9BACT|nr:Gfo/Idh/MocA family oxidoreductase [Poriferisphaera corsica]QDU34839.1 1,5-anhydro-D-fructose reductase [Poriferisphaera corsica]
MADHPHKLRYGILSTGNIARQFAHGVQEGASLSTIHAVASRDPRNALTFANTYNIPKPHNSYDDLINDPNIDAIYVALPNNYHHEWTIRALNAGKHVLCEKPLAVTTQQATEMFQAAEQNDRHLAEAFMYLTHPLTKTYIQSIKNGDIGTPKLLRTSFSFSVAYPENNSRFSTALAGGSIMDIGCYCVTLALLVADATTSPGSYPSQIHAIAHLHESGIDDYAAVTLRFPNNLIVSFVSGMTAQMDNTTYISGDNGYIQIPVPWKPPVQNATFHIDHNIPSKQDKLAKPTGSSPNQKQSFNINTPNDKPLYALEADAFADTILNDAPPFITPEFSLRTARILDEIRSQINLPF